MQSRCLIKPTMKNFLQQYWYPQIRTVGALHLFKYLLFLTIAHFLGRYLYYLEKFEIYLAEKYGDLPLLKSMF